MKKQKGFTIIELIVVIAIIAVLAAIVLVNVTQYIAKSRNSAIKGNLASLLTNSATYYDTNSAAYTGFDTDASVGCDGPIDAAITGAGGSLSCIATATAFCACSTLNTTTPEPANSYFCVDSTGAKRAYTGLSTDTCATLCPAAGACTASGT